MVDLQVYCLSDLHETKKRETVELFVDGFRNIFLFTENKFELIELFLPSLDTSMIYVCCYKEKIVGVIGIGTNKKRVFCFDIQVCQKIFGKIRGMMIYKQLKMIAETPAVKNDSDLYIDYLTTDTDMRGKGIATKLLDFACQLPEYDECYLEVLSKNTNAKRLYEKLGFKVYKKSFNFFTVIQGFGYPIKMKKRIK
ncbi:MULTISPECIES: GNAT family N-acetyltransferase [unclassified Clostridium]|uniref:GNAT family N-acetyltransferase n=1 Tax=unclassified Clostridium TaxID=2614128 RepID=UPI0025C64164|nr:MULTISPECIES: N-acetyltransferase [unclassified Clostridium]